MNATLVVSFLRQRLTSPIRLVMIGFLLLTSLGLVAATRSLDAIQGMGLLFGFVLAAGAIGQEVASGVLTLTFARPVTRASYVLSRWFAAGAMGAGLALAQVALGLAFVLLRAGAAPAAGDLAALAVEDVVLSFTGAAVMVMLSSLANGLGDVGLWALGLFTASMLEGLGQLRDWPALVRAAKEVQGALFPHLHAGWLFGRGDAGWFELASVLSTLAASLAVAVWVVNRKELSYAAG